MESIPIHADQHNTIIPPDIDAILNETDEETAKKLIAACKKALLAKPEYLLYCKVGERESVFGKIFDHRHRSPLINQLLEELINEGVFNQPLPRGHNLLREIAKGLLCSDFLKILISRSTNLPAAFQYGPDLKDDARMLVGDFVRLWFALSAIIAVNTALIYGLLAFLIYMSLAIVTPLPLLFAQIIVSTVVIGLASSLFMSLADINRHYVQAPRCLGTLQRELLDYLPYTPRTVLLQRVSENPQWLWVPLDVFGNNAITLLVKSRQHTDIYNAMPHIVKNPSALNFFLSDKTIHRLLKNHPNFFTSLISQLTMEQFLLHQAVIITLFEAQSANMNTIKQDPAALTPLFRDLIIFASTTHDAALNQLIQTWGPIAVPATLPDSTPRDYLSRGYRHLRFFQTPLTREEANCKAMDAFRAVSITDQDAHQAAQRELMAYYLAQTSTELKAYHQYHDNVAKGKANNNPEPIPLASFFQAMSHYHHLRMIIPASENIPEELYFKNLSDDTAYQQSILKDVTPRTWAFKTQEGDMPILLAAKLGYWSFVRLLLNQIPENCDPDPSQYEHLLSCATLANQTDLLSFLPHAQPVMQ